MIREATIEDVPRLVELAARFLAESIYGSIFETNPEAIAALIDQCLKLGTILVVEDTEPGRYGTTALRVIGMLAIVAIPHPLSGQIIAEEVAWFVEPEHRTGLLGPKMLRAAEEWATRKRANVVKMVAPAGSTVGDFYEKVGYRPVETAYIKTI